MCMPDLTAAQTFVSELLAEVKPLMREAAREEWESAATGEPEHDERLARLRAQIMRIYADPERFARVRAIRSAGIDDALLARQVQLLENSFAKGQQDEATIEQITRVQKEVDATF